MIGDKFLKNLNTISHIKDVVCAYYGIDKTELNQEKITKKNMLIRQKIIYLYYCTKTTDRFTLSSIGICFGGMSWINVERAKQTVENRMEVSKEYKNEIEKLKLNL